MVSACLARCEVKLRAVTEARPIIYAFNTHADRDPLVQNWAVVGRPEHQGRFQGSAILLARMAAWINLMMKDSVSASSDFGELSAFCTLCNLYLRCSA